MEVDDCLLRGDDSSWNMSDWQWDSQAFRAKPVVDPTLQSSSKKCRTENQIRSQIVSAPCGGCKARQSTFAVAPAPDTGRSAESKGCAIPAAALLCTDSPSQETAKAVIAGKKGSEQAKPHECSCQADGCSSNLLQQSVWHQKSRICDQHMSGVFLKQGKAQQFCQQCGRSHTPDAFDKDRRSCRTQLAKHAARRRKRNATGNIKSSNFPQPDTAPEGAVPAITMPTGCKAAASLAALAQQGASPEAFFQNLCSTVRKSSSTASLSQALDSEHRHTSGASDQSLVSQPNFRQQLQLAAEPALAAYQQAHTSTVEPYDATVDSMLATEDKSFLQLPLLPQPSPAAPGALADDPLQDLLNWQLPETGDSQPHLSSFDHAMAFMQDTCDGTQTSFQQQLPSLPRPPAFSPQEPVLGIPAVSAGAAYLGSLPSQALVTDPPAQIPAMAAAQQAYPSSFAAMRLTVKLFNCTPAQLPANLRQQLTGWLNCAPAGVEGYIRPGCVHLTMSATLPSQPSGAQPTAGHAHTLQQAVRHLLATPEQDIWHRSTMLVQLGSEAAVVHQGSIVKVWSLAAQADTASGTASAAATEGCKQGASCGGAPASAPSKLPLLQCPEPACLVAGHQQLQTIRLEAQSWTEDCALVCRAGGKHWEVQALPQASQKGDHADWHSHRWEVLLPHNLPAGLLFLEAQKGSFMSSELPILVAPSAAMAQESLHLLHSTLTQDRQGLITDLGSMMGNTNKGSLLLAKAACQLLVRAVQQGLPNLTRHLMVVVMKENVGLLGQVRGLKGMGLLHLAVKAGSCAVVAALLQPTAAAPVWQASWRGPAGLTPLHLAALLPGGQPIALQLCTAFGARQWLTAAADDGLTPAQFAIQLGKHGLHQAITSLVSGPAKPTAGKTHLPTNFNQQHLDPVLGRAGIWEAAAASGRTEGPIHTSTQRLRQPVASVLTEQVESGLDKPAAIRGQKRACPSEEALVPQQRLKLNPSGLELVLHEAPHSEMAHCCSTQDWASSSCSETSCSSGSSSGEEDCCISEPHVFSQLSWMPMGGPVPRQGELTGFLQQQKQRLAALCRMSGWRAAGVQYR